MSVVMGGRGVGKKNKIYGKNKKIEMIVNQGSKRHIQQYVFLFGV